MRLYEEYGFCQEAVLKVLPGAGGRCSDHVEPPVVTGLLELRRKYTAIPHLKLQNPVYIPERIEHSSPFAYYGRKKRDHEERRYIDEKYTIRMDKLELICNGRKTAVSKGLYEEPYP